MYERWLRGPDDPPLTPKAVTYHSGTRSDFRDRCLRVLHEAATGGRAAVQELGPYLLKWIGDARMLRAAWDYLAAYGGESPGPNGRRYRDLGNQEVWGLLTALGKAVRASTYRHGPVRTIQILKDPADPERGTRKLTLLNIEDRLVQRAVVQIMGPLLDPLFGPNVLGFRPGRNRLHALALADRMALQARRFVWVTEDIRDAFDNVPIGPLLEVVQKYVPAGMAGTESTPPHDVPALIERIVRAGGRKRGVPQGGPLSPWLLNLYLMHFLDRPWIRAHPEIPMIRVADDLLLLCRTQKEARAAWRELDDLLRRAGMPLKHGPVQAIHDLRRGDSPDWLGFQVKRGEAGLEFRIADRAWGRLSQHLEFTHEKPDSPIRANETINSWIHQLGPCYRAVKRSRVCARIERLADEQGFSEIPSRSALLSRWRRAYAAWESLRAEETSTEADSCEPVLVPERKGSAVTVPF